MVEVLNALILEKRPKRPEKHAFPDSLWELMQLCWAQTAVSRPSASSVVEHLRAMKDKTEHPTLAPRGLTG